MTTKERDIYIYIYIQEGKLPIVMLYHRVRNIARWLTKARGSVNEIPFPRTTKERVSSRSS